MISVVCVYNNREILERWLLPSLKRQTAEHELCLVDNTKGEFPSAASALNHGGRKAKGDHILFVHQDVSLSTTDWLESVERTLGALPDLGIAGVAGKTKKGRYTYSNAEHGPFPSAACNYRVKQPMTAQTLDECLFIIPRAVFRDHKLNTKLCPNWHFYAVEYCLRMARHGLNAYVLPQPIYHWAGQYVAGGELFRSRDYPFKLPDDYFVTLRLLLAEYGDLQCIPTCSGDWSPKLPIAIQRLELWKTWRFFISNDGKIKRLCRIRPVAMLGRRIMELAIKVDPDRALQLSKTHIYARLRDAYAPRTQSEMNKLKGISAIHEHLTILELLTRELKLKRVLELGVETGQSSLEFLHGVKDIGGHVVSMDIEDCPEAKKAVAAEGLTPFWTFIKADDMTYDWKGEIDHLFIDTSHAYGHTLAELEKYEPFVRPGGVLTFHDIISFPGVQRAIDDYLKDRPNLRRYQFFHNNGLAVIFKDGGTPASS